MESKAGAQNEIAQYSHSQVEEREENLQTLLEFNGIEEVYFSAVTSNYQKPKQKFDTGASRCMSGVQGRLQEISPMDDAVQITGFNGSVSMASLVGVNSDGKQEYFVPNMPSDLVLLCGHAYASDGAAILYKNGGMVVKLDSNELEELLHFVNKFQVIKRLKVSNRTYEVADSVEDLPLYQSNPDSSLSLFADSSSPEELEAFSSTATRFFNTKVNVSNTTERILTLLLTGLSFNDLYQHVKNHSLDGIPPDVTISSLNHFEHKYGRTPDIIRMALPFIPKNHTGLMTPPEVLSKSGQRVEIDFMEPDYNEEIQESDQRRVRKLPSHGGAIAASVAVDCYTGFLSGKLVKSQSNTKVVVEETIDLYHLHNIAIELMSADSGVISQSKFSVFKPEVEAYLHSRGIKTERAEPHNHSRGTSHVERAIRAVKDLTRIAILYILRNPNFPIFGFSKINILKLWGELFHWAITVINLKPSVSNDRISKYEAFTGIKPNLQNIRLLPIFSVVLVPRDPLPSSETNTLRHDLGLYVGPSLVTPGSIRVAVMTNDVLSILITSRFTAATDGGGLNIHHHVHRGLQSILSAEVEQKRLLKSAVDSPVREITEEEPPSSPETLISKSLNPPPFGSDVPRRSSRLRAMVKRKLDESANHSVEGVEEESPSEETINAFFADWSTHNEHQMYFSFVENQFVCVNSMLDVTMFEEGRYASEDSFKAVTENVPKTFDEALRHPIWGDAARAELNTLISTKAIVAVDSELAKNCIFKEGADLVILFPVYEQKMRDGKLVYKVRLVSDGRTHYNAGMTYSATPSREELLILLHLIAAFDWEYVHLDEKRAFLSAPYQGEKPIFTKFRGKGTQFYQILGALYGLKTSPKDYQDSQAKRFLKLGYKRLTMCSCIYIYQEGDKIVIVYVFVDDFIFTGNSRDFLEAKINEFRTVASTTEPDWNAPVVLGLEISRIRDRKVITCKMTGKIEEVCQRFGACQTQKKRSVPIPPTHFIIKDEDFAEIPAAKARFLTASERSDYLAVIGSLIWISGLRLDILFAVLYLTWATKTPRQHHFDCAILILEYLYQTKEMPLVLGGMLALLLIAYSDASLGTATRGRSTIGHLARLSPLAGAIFAQAKATATVMTSSFECELDGAATAVKTMSRIRNILTELQQHLSEVPTLYCDNLAMVEFIKGNGVAKSVRHMELRQWYIREQVLLGHLQALHHPGRTLPADKLTKLSDSASFQPFVYDIMGHALLTDHST